MPTSPSPSASPSQVHTFASRSVVACFEIGSHAMEQGYRGSRSLVASAGRTATQRSGRQLPKVCRCLISTSRSTILKMKTCRRRLSKHKERVVVWIAILCAAGRPFEVSATELCLRLPLLLNPDEERGRQLPSSNRIGLDLLPEFLQSPVQAVSLAEDKTVGAEYRFTLDSSMCRSSVATNLRGAYWRIRQGHKSFESDRSFPLASMGCTVYVTLVPPPRRAQQIISSLSNALLALLACHATWNAW
jgi:hypothetical protein